jgi:hypothetical protein
VSGEESHLARSVEPRAVPSRVKRNLLATTRTRTSGAYRFAGLDLGAYQLTVVNAAGATLSNVAGRFVQITRGGDVNNIDLPLARVSPTAAVASTTMPSSSDQSSLFDNSSNSLFA